MSSKGKEDASVQEYADPNAMMGKYFPIDVLLAELKDRGGVIKCKLVLIKLEETKELLQKVMALISAGLGANEYGLLHACVFIGNYLLHFFDDGLVHFTPFKAKKPFVAVDIGELDLNNETDIQKLNKVMNICTEYNTQKKYDRLRCSCHHFTKDVCEALEMKSNFDGQLGTFLDRIRFAGKFETTFVDPFSHKTFKFETHRELDEYVCNLIAQHPEFDSDPAYIYDLALLKAFDRGFYMAFYQEEKKPQSKRNSKPFCPYCCPFDDPYKATLF